jgi:hypothetical protein
MSGQSTWGSPTNQAQLTAHQIDHIADKAKFGLDIVKSELHSIGALRKEIGVIVGQPHPPQSSQIASIGVQLEAIERKLGDAVTRISEMMTEIDRTTDNIQNQRSSW